MSLVGLLKALESRLQAAADGVAGVDMRGFNVAIAPGRFDAYELTRESFRAPAFRIAFLGAGKSKALANEERAFDAAMGVFVITDRKGRDTDGVALAEWIAARIELWSNHGLRGIGVPKDVRIEALHGGELGERGVALHAVAWTQAVRIGTDEIGAGVHDPDALIAVSVDQLEMEIAETDLQEGI